MKNAEKKLIYDSWKELVNMTSSELKAYYNSKDGSDSGLSKSEAEKQGIRNGRASARALFNMIPTGKTFQRAINNWTRSNWEWAAAQVSFIKRMSGLKGPLYRQNGERSRKLKALLIWGHNPEK